MNSKPSQNTLLDKLILFFIFLFLGSLSVSIFVNQIGYYGALILLLYKYFKEKENPFSVNGLEIFILLYIAAEILATIFAVERGASFHNLLKRFLLLPMIYLVAAAAKDFAKAKFFLLTYIGFALLGVVLYLGFSVHYYVMNLYQIEQSGPGIFQYPITTSELMSFTTVILFAFCIDEKNSLKNRLRSFAGFALTALALLATYKRTGWIGAAAGIVMVIIIKRKWLLLAPIVIGALLIVILEKEKSEVIIFNAGKELKEMSRLKTDGRANDILVEKNSFWLADYENGIVKYTDEKPVKKIATASPVSKLYPVNDTLLIAELIDTRYVLYKKDEAKGLTQVHEFASPGFTIQFCFNNQSLFILDKDSGLTVFPKFLSSNNCIRKPGFASFTNMFCDSSSLVLYSAKDGLTVYRLAEGIPDTVMFNRKFDDELTYVNYINNELIIEDKKSVKLFSVDSSTVKLTAETNEMKALYLSELHDSAAYLLNNKGVIYKIAYPFNGSLNISNKFTTGFLPKAFTFDGDKLYTAKLKNSRVASIVDPYQPSNFTRFALWRAGFKMFKDHPVFGVGDIDLAKLYVKYKHFYDKEIQGHLHNNYIHILVTLGLFGFIVVMMLLVKIFLLYIKIYNTVKDEVFSSSFAAGAVGCFTAFLFAGLTEWNFGDHEVITMVWFITGLNIAFYKIYLAKKTAK